MKALPLLHRNFCGFIFAIGFLFFCCASVEDSFKCPEQFGYYPDMEDCSQYYVCVFGDSLHEKCTGGLYFSIELQTCDWPRNVECAKGVKQSDVVEFPVDDEVFSSSRRTSATATSGRPRQPNSEPVSNYQPYDGNEESRDYSRNSQSRSQDNPRARQSLATTASPSLSTSQPKGLSAIATTTSIPPQQRQQTNPTTYPDRPTYEDGINAPSTVSEDPLYASDEHSKVSSPLDNYDPQQPEYDEAAPPLIDSEGGIHIADGGHGLDAFAGLAHLPGLGDFSVFEKPIYNANTGTSAEHSGDTDYNNARDQRKRDPSSSRNPTAVSTKPRSLESFPSNNGRSKDPDVIIDYSNGNKDLGYSYQDRQRNYGTPPPTIFDDNADHRDYGGFDIITPLKSNIQDDHNPATFQGNTPPESKKDQQSINSYNNKPKVQEVPVIDTQPLPELTRIEPINDKSYDSISAIEPNVNVNPNSQNTQNQENLQRVNPNVEKNRTPLVKLLDSDSPPREAHSIDLHQEVPRLPSNSNYNGFTYESNPNSKNTEYESLDITRPSKELGNSQQNNAAVNLDKILSTNNGNHRDPDIRYSKSGNDDSHRDMLDKPYSDDVVRDPHPNNRPINIQPQEQPNYETSGNQRPPVEDTPVVIINDAHYDDTRLIPPTDTKDVSRFSTAKEQKSHLQNDQPEVRFTEVRKNNGEHKDPDTSFGDMPLDEDFGIYTGSKRQNRTVDTNADSIPNQSIGGSKPNVTPAESIQPAVRQPNQVNHQIPYKDKSPKDEVQEPPKSENPSYNDQYDNGYGEYDSPKPHFTDDYYTNTENQETTTRTTPIRTRPTRPRKTTTTTTTTTTTPAPIRIRTRRPIGQVTRPNNKPSYVATTPASPPYRPTPLYPTPPPYTPAQKCDPRKCRLPDCRCGGTDIPEGMPVNETPQIVLLTFDDAVNDLNHDLYNELFNTGRLNPNGCPILGTFYVSHEWTDYGQVQTLYSHGHEIASHSITHSYGEKFSKNQWMREIHGQREILHLYGGVKMEDIRGMRSPFLQIGGNKMFEMLYDANFTYDSSMPVYENNPPFWPYTLDYALSHDCMIFPCPTKSYPGLWEVGMVMWVDLRGGRCSMGDACSNPPDEEAVTKMLMKNFNRHYKSNRAPFGLFYHSAWFNTQHHRRGFMKFLDEILQNEDVWLVTNSQLIEWMRNPTPIGKMKDFEPFNCRRLDRPPPCPSPTVCNVWYQGGVRYMKTCQPCPAKYPWIGNTGYDSNNRG